MKSQIACENGFIDWWLTLDDEEKQAIHAAVAELLEQPSPNAGSLSQMGELHVEHQQQDYKILYALNPKQTTLLLIAGKTSISAQLH